MESNVKYTRIKQKIDSSSNWSKNNPILLDGEIGIEKETGKIKIGDGVTKWSQLNYKPGLGSKNRGESFNQNTIASGTNSHAEGEYTTASGSQSHAEGQYTVAFGYSSHTEGNATQATGSCSHAEGYATRAGCKGYNVQGTQDNKAILTSVEGLTTGMTCQFYILDTFYSSTAKITAIDTINRTVTLSSMPSNLGSGCMLSVKDNPNLGTSSIPAANAHAEGYQTKAYNNHSHAEGYQSEVWGQYSHAEGYQTKATGQATHAEGSSTVTSGQGAHAEGVNTQSLQYASHAEGAFTEANDSAAHAEGIMTKATKTASHAEGFATKANSYAQHVQGQYNIEDTKEKYAHIVGNGTSSKASNAHTLDWKGNSWYQGNIKRGGSSYDDETAKTVTAYAGNYDSTKEYQAGDICSITEDNIYDDNNFPYLSLKLDNTLREYLIVNRDYTTYATFTINAEIASDLDFYDQFRALPEYTYLTLRDNINNKSYTCQSTKITNTKYIINVENVPQKVLNTKNYFSGAVLSTGQTQYGITYRYEGYSLFSIEGTATTNIAKVNILSPLSWLNPATTYILSPNCSTDHLYLQLNDIDKTVKMPSEPFTLNSLGDGQTVDPTKCTLALIISEGEEVNDLLDFRLQAGTTFVDMTVQDGFSKDLELRIPLTVSAGSTAIFDGTNWKVLSQGISDKVASATKADSATTADKLKTSRKISLNTGVTAAGYFDGSSDLNLTVTNLANDYMNWSPYDVAAKKSSILDDALLSDTTNVFGFFPADCIDIEYSVDGGTTWLDYGVADWYKRNFVTPESLKSIGLTQIKIGQDVLPTTTQQKVRITISADKGNERILYCVLRKLKFKFSSTGAAGCTVKFFKENYANRDTWIQQNSSTVTGWPAWYTMNCNLTFGSNSSAPESDSSAYHYSRIRLEFSIQGLTSQSTATTANKFTIYCLCGISDNIYYFNSNYIDSCWINNHKPYRLDIGKNTYFFGDIYGNLVGNATKAQQDSEGNIIKDTYLKASEATNLITQINALKEELEEMKNKREGARVVGSCSGQVNKTLTLNMVNGETTWDYLVLYQDTKIDGSKASDSVEYTYGYMANREIVITPGNSKIYLIKCSTGGGSNKPSTSSEQEVQITIDNNTLTISATTSSGNTTYAYAPFNIVAYKNN